MMILIKIATMITLMTMRCDVLIMVTISSNG